MNMKMKIPSGPSVKIAQKIIRQDQRKGWADLSIQYGKNFIFQGNLVTSDAELTRILLMEREHTLQRSAVYKFMSWLIPGAPGVLFMDGETWQKRVHAVMPVFTKANIESYGKTIHDMVMANVQSWKNGMLLNDLYMTITKIGLQVVLKVGYGLDPSNELVAAYGNELMEYKLLTMNSKSRIDGFGFSTDQLLLLPTHFKDIRYLKKRMKIQKGLLEEILVQLKNDEQDGIDWINLFSKAGFSLNEMTNELNHIYGAFNAIDYTITCALYELSRNKNWVTILRNELASVIGPNRHPGREDVDALPNTINFMKEVYRYYPVAIAVMRKTGKPLRVEGVNYPSGKEVIIALQAMHHHPDYWEEPLVFNPDRWKLPLKEPRAYIPFLQGPRQCIGKHLAELHFLITLNAIIQHCSFEIEAPVKIGPYMIPRFEKPIPAIVHFNQPLINQYDTQA